jgi:hypothetical protein
MWQSTCLSNDVLNWQYYPLTFILSPSSDIFPISVLYYFLISPVRAVYPAHLLLLGLITLNATDGVWGSFVRNWYARSDSGMEFESQ